MLFTCSNDLYSCGWDVRRAAGASDIVIHVGTSVQMWVRCVCSCYMTMAMRYIIHNLFRFWHDDGRSWCPFYIQFLVFFVMWTRFILHFVGFCCEFGFFSLLLVLADFHRFSIQAMLVTWHCCQRMPYKRLKEDNNNNITLAVTENWEKDAWWTILQQQQQKERNQKWSGRFSSCGIMVIDHCNETINDHHRA